MILPISWNTESITHQGVSSVCYKLKLPDLDVISTDEIEIFHENLTQAISRLKGDKFYKFYKFSNELYLNTDCEENLNLGVELEKIAPVELINLYTNGDHEVLFEPSHFYDEKTYRTIFSMYTLPNDVYNLLLSEFESVQINFYPKVIKNSRRFLDRKRRLHHGNLFKNIQDFDSSLAYKQNNDLLLDVKSARNNLLDLEVFITLEAKSENELADKVKVFKERVDQLGFEFRREVRLLQFCYIKNIPGVRSYKFREHLTPCNIASKFLPVSKDHLQSKTDQSIELFSRTHQEVYLDLFSKEAINYNCLITGESGAGKSMIANKIIHHYASKNVKAIIVDLGNSFKRNIEYLGGSQLSTTFNPFQYNDPEYLLAFIKSIVTDLSKSESGAIFKILRDSEVTITNLDQLLELIKDARLGIENYFEEIRKYFCTEKIELTNLTYVDLSLYPDEIKAPLLVFLIRQFKSMSGERIFLFDECWSFLKSNGEFIAETFRTLRKLNGSAIAISQNLDDFLSTDLGRVVFANTYYKFLFKQDLFNDSSLSMLSREKLKTVYSRKDQYSEFITLIENRPKVCRYIASSLENVLFNTTASFSIQVENYLKNHRGVEPKELYLSMAKIFE